jgi:hypothetical protein
LLLNVKPEGPENDADCCGARAGCQFWLAQAALRAPKSPNLLAH